METGAPNHQGPGALPSDSRLSLTTRVFRPRTTSDLEASPPMNRAHTPLHPDNPSPPSMSSFAQSIMTVGGATPWHSPASMRMTGPHGLNGPAHALGGGIGGGICRPICAKNRGSNGGYVSRNPSGSWFGPPTITRPVIPLSSSSATPAPLGPAIVLSGSAFASTGVNAPSGCLSDPPSSTDSEDHKRLNVKVVGLGGSIWATPEAAAKAVPKSIEYFYEKQAEGEAKYNRQVNASALCQGRTSPSLPTSLKNVQSVISNSAPLSTPLSTTHTLATTSPSVTRQPPSADQLFAAMRNANPQASAAVITKSSRSVSTPSTDSEGRKRLENVKVVGLSSSRWATPEAAATSVAKPIKDCYKNQSEGEAKYDRQVNVSALCQSNDVRPATAAVLSVTTSIPHHLRGTPGPQARITSAFSTGRAPSREVRPDSTDLVARRMISRALGVGILKKEDARRMAIDSALAENAKDGNTIWADVKKDLKEDKAVKHDMVKLGEGVSDSAIVDKETSKDVGIDSKET